MAVLTKARTHDPKWPQLVKIRVLNSVRSFDAALAIRYAFSGLATALACVALTVAFKFIGVPFGIAYPVAFLLAVQFNFVLSDLLVWTTNKAERGLTIWRRLLAFHFCTAASIIVNLAAFFLLSFVVFDEAAAVAGILVSVAVKFHALDNFAFAPSGSVTAT